MNSQILPKISSPCPFVPTPMNKNMEGHYCKSCKKTLLDFRKMSNEEIIQYIGTNTCGIFNSAQLQPLDSLPLRKRTVFLFLSILSVLGFSVSPLKAQSKKDTAQFKIPTATQQDSTKTTETPKAKQDSRKKKTGLFRRKRNYRVMGCPDF
jgi:hypothetical protein